MPVFQIDIEKVQGAEYWTNVWHVLASDFATARDYGVLIVAAERLIHSTNVGFTKWRIGPFPTVPGIFEVIPLSGTGSRTFSGGQLPLFNVALVNIAAGLGRPARKYFRAPVYEGDQEDGSLTIAFRAIVDDAVNGLYSDGVVLCKPDGTIVQVAKTQVLVGMHQLRRGAKRKLPVI